jgi:hypothetical protein
MNTTRQRLRQRPPRAAWHTLILLLALLGPPPGATAMNSTSWLPTCAGPYPLMLRTPACALRPRRRAKPLPVRPCGPELCGLRGPGPNMLPAKPPMDAPCDTPTTSPVAAHAAGTRGVSASAPAHHGEAEKWWKKEADLWVDVHTEEEFEQAVTAGDRLVLVGGWRVGGALRARTVRAAAELQCSCNLQARRHWSAQRCQATPIPAHSCRPPRGAAPRGRGRPACAPLALRCAARAPARPRAPATSPPRPCPADFFATWCNGCQRSYPELCKFARDPELSSQVKFVKVRGHRSLSGRPGGGRSASTATAAVLRELAAPAGTAHSCRGAVVMYEQAEYAGSGIPVDWARRPLDCCAPAPARSALRSSSGLPRRRA